MKYVTATILIVGFLFTALLFRRREAGAEGPEDKESYSLGTSLEKT